MNDPDLVQAFLKKWWVESDFKAPNLPLSLRLKYHQSELLSLTEIIEHEKTTTYGSPPAISFVIYSFFLR
jgi:hypothetical protein